MGERSSMEKGIMRSGSLSAGCRSEAAEEVLLADLHAVVAEDVVGRDGMKKEVGQRKVQQIVLPGKTHFLAAQLEYDRPPLAAGDDVGAKALQKNGGLGDARLQFRKSGFGILVTRYLGASQPCATTLCRVGRRLHLSGQRKHVGRKAR